MKTKNLKVLLAKRLVKDIFANLGDLFALMAKGPLPMRKASEWQTPDFFATPPASHVQNVQEAQEAQEPQDAQDAQEPRQNRQHRLSLSPKKPLVHKKPLVRKTFQRKKPEERQISTYARVR